MKNSPNLTDEQKLQIEAEYEKTQVFSQIAINLNVTLSQVVYYAKGKGLKGLRPPLVFTEEIKLKILAEYEHTKILKEIAKNLELSEHKVQQYAKLLGIKGVRKSKFLWVDEVTVACSKCGKHLLFTELEIIRPNSEKPSRISYCRKCRTNQVINNNKITIENHFANRIRDLRTRAKTLGIPFDLTADSLAELYKLQEGKCFYTDVVLEVPTSIEIKPATNRHSLSVDKVIPELGYTKANIVLCTVRANAIKGSCTPTEMKEWLPLWYSRLILKFPLFKA